MHSGKMAAAIEAASLVETGMVVGLGSGSTANLMIAELAARRLDIHCVASSEASASLAVAHGLKLLERIPNGGIDLTLDGADEVTPFLELTKGGGGCLLMEKIVAAASKRFVIMVDTTKVVDKLGHFPLPVEITQFGREHTMKLIGELADRHSNRHSNRHPAVRLRNDRNIPFVTDSQNNIVDIHFDAAIEYPGDLEACLLHIPGVVETGFFFDMVEFCIVGQDDGSVKFITSAIE